MNLKSASQSLWVSASLSLICLSSNCWSLNVKERKKTSSKKAVNAAGHLLVLVVDMFDWFVVRFIGRLKYLVFWLCWWF